MKKLGLALAIPFLLPALAAAQHTLRGVVSWDGPPIKAAPIRMDADPKCAALVEGERQFAKNRLVSEEGGVQYVFVYVKDGAEVAGETTAPEEPVRLVQSGCWYQPRVLGIQAQQTLSIVNDDPTLHNVRSLAKTNRPFNIGQPPERPPREKSFPLPEAAVKFRCDVHPWMEAYVFVMDHPLWAVTDADGAFSISGLPPGSHTLVAWHEAFGDQEVEVEVSGDTTGVDVTFSP